MTRYIAFLRGINVSGQKKVPMAELRKLLVSTGFGGVQTYIQTGNVIFNTSSNNLSLLEETMQDAIKNYFGFDVPVIVKTVRDIENIIDNNPFSELQKLSSYYVLPFSSLKQENVIALSNQTYPNEMFTVTNSCVYLYCETGYGRAKCNNNFFERKLKVIATTRNHKTMLKLLSLCAEN